MKKKANVKRGIKDLSPELQTLKRGKYASTKAKLEWLESAYYFGKFKKFS